MRRILLSSMAAVILAIGLTIVPTSTATASQPATARAGKMGFAPEQISPARLAERRAALAAKGIFPPPVPKGAHENATINEWLGPYLIVNLGFQMCLDADLGTIGGNFTKVQMWACSQDEHPPAQQLWWIWNLNSTDQVIESAYPPNRALEAYGLGGGDGTGVELYDYWAGDNQQWRPTQTDGYNHRYQNVKFWDKLLDADSNCWGVNGCKTQLWRAVGGLNQYWHEIKG